MHARKPDEWRDMKSDLEKFGHKSGLFDDDVREGDLAGTSSSPSSWRYASGVRRRKGARRNLIDVGYGVSQILPLLVELLEPARIRATMFLLQQPEVHLHPSAQAELGSLFCASAGVPLSTDRRNA